jgi:integrase
MSSRRGKNEGSIYQRKDGRWVGVVTLERSGGKRQRVYRYGARRRDVVLKLDELRRQVAEGTNVAARSRTFERYLKDFLATWKPRVRQSAWNRYEGLVRLQITPTLGRVRLDKLTPQHFEKLYAKLLDDGLSAQTVLHVHRVAHVALKHAVRSGLLTRNVTDHVAPPRPTPKHMATLSADQVRALFLAAAGDRLEALYVLAITTGMRQGELLALRWSSVNLKAKRLAVTETLQRDGGHFRFEEPKTKASRRQVEVSELAIEALRQHRRRQVQERLAAGPLWTDHDLVFANAVGNPINVSNLVPRSFNPLLAKAGIPRIRFHDLRHTAATLLLELGEHPKVVQEMLGHSQVGVTLDLYSHVTPTMHRQAADRFDRLLG